MTSVCACASFCADPFQDVEPQIVLKEAEHPPEHVTLREISGYRQPIVTHDAWMLVDSFRAHGLSLPLQIIDIPTAIKLFTGQPRSKFHGQYPWDYWLAIKPYFAKSRQEASYQSLRDTFFSKRHLSLNTPEIRDLLSIEVEHATALWRETNQLLHERGEADRFWNIEVPIYNLFLQRQLHGISADKEQIASHIEALTQEHFRALRELRTVFRVPEAELSWSGLTRYVIDHEPFLAHKPAHLENFDDYLRLLSYRSTLAATVEKYRRSLQDKLTLERIGVSDDRVYPVFDIVGTVTGRILVTDPLLQNLRRRYRAILAADQGKELAYLDYKQFEPGILAYETKDDALLAMYNEADVYAVLSERLFGDRAQRDLCKRIFLAISYGMEEQSVADLLAKTSDSGQTAATFADTVRKFFAQFRTISNWKHSLLQELKTSHRIGTPQGNFRYRSDDGDLTRAEQRWAVSQRVQGTASLILKRSVLRLAPLAPKLEVLLPMHDAVLLQVEQGSSRVELLNEAGALLASEFRALCPTIHPVVELKPFDG